MSIPEPLQAPEAPIVGYLSSCKVCRRPQDRCECSEVQNFLRSKCDRCLATDSDCSHEFPCLTCVRVGAQCSYDLTRQPRCTPCAENGSACDHRREGCSPCRIAGLPCYYPNISPSSITIKHSADATLHAKDRYDRAVCGAEETLPQSSIPPSDGLQLPDRRDVPAEHETVPHPRGSGAEIHQRVTTLLQNLYQHVKIEYSSLGTLQAQLQGLQQRSVGEVDLREFNWPTKNEVNELLEVYWTTFGEIYPIVIQEWFEETYTHSWPKREMTLFDSLILAMMACALPLTKSSSVTYVGKFATNFILVKSWIAHALQHCVLSQQQTSTPLARQTQCLLWIACQISGVDWLEYARLIDVEDVSLFEHWTTHPLLFCRISVDTLDEVSDGSALLRHVDTAVLNLGLDDALRFSCVGVEDRMTEQLRTYLDEIFMPDAAAGRLESSSDIPSDMFSILRLRYTCDRALRERTCSTSDIQELLMKLESATFNPQIMSRLLPSCRAFFELQQGQYILLLSAKLLLMYGSPQSHDSGPENTEQSMYDLLEYFLRLTASWANDCAIDFYHMQLLIRHTTILDPILVMMSSIAATCELAVAIEELLPEIIAITQRSCIHLGYTQMAFWTFIWCQFIGTHWTTVLGHPSMSTIDTNAVQIALHPLLAAMDGIVENQEAKPDIQREDLLTALLPPESVHQHALLQGLEALTDMGMNESDHSP